MAIIPNGEKVLMTSADVNTTYGGSAALKQMNQWYTIEDIAETIGGGGGGYGDFVIEANGTMGQGFNVSYSVNASVPSVQAGINVYPVKSYANVSIYNNSGYGSTFTATEAAFPGLTEVGSININGTPLTIIDLPDLESVAGSMAYFSFNQNQLLTTLLAPSLIAADNVNISNNSALANIDFSSLVTVSQQFNIDNTAITQLSSVQLPVLETLNTLQSGNLTSINLPSIKKLNSLSINGSSLTSVIFPNTEHLNGYGINLSQKPNLTSVVLGTIGTLKRVTNSSASTVYNFAVDFSLCSLNEASVNGILTLMASLDGTNGTCLAMNGVAYLSGGNNAIPTGAGLTAVQTLLNRDWAVSVNS